MENTCKKYCLPIVIILSLSSLVFFFLFVSKSSENQTLRKTLAKYQAELLQKKNNSVVLPFDPSKKYVDSIGINQTISGRVTKFDKTSSIVTIEKLGETAEVKLPANLSINTIDTKHGNDIKKFKAGDTIRLVERYMPNGGFEISWFAIANDYVKNSK